MVASEEESCHWTCVLVASGGGGERGVVSSKSMVAGGARDGDKRGRVPSLTFVNQLLMVEGGVRSSLSGSRAR